MSGAPNKAVPPTPNLSYLVKSMKRPTYRCCQNLLNCARPGDTLERLSSVGRLRLSCRRTGVCLNHRGIPEGRVFEMYR